MENNLSHEFFMKRAISQALLFRGLTEPNPCVGSVLVYKNKIVSQGYHKGPGTLHAEREAILQSPIDPQLCTLYVTLEPCCHHGRTPPCTDLILETKIPHVVVGTLDPHDVVAGKGIEILRKNDVKVEVGILEKECQQLNPFFHFFHEHKRPYILLKTAMSLDGKIALPSYESQWITGESAREYTQKIRSLVSAIAVGHHTFLHDKPQLTCRLLGFEKKNLKRFIFSRDQMSPPFETMNPHWTQKEFFDFCFKNEIQSLLIEGGSKLIQNFINNYGVDEYFLFIAPFFIGEKGIPAFSLPTLSSLKDTQRLHLEETLSFKNDTLIHLSKEKRHFFLTEDFHL